MNFYLRNLGSDELEWLYQLSKESYKDVVVKQFGEWDDELQRRLFHDRWRDPLPAKIIVAGRRRAGLVILEEKATFNWLKEIQISDEFRNRGIGTALIKQFAEEARSRSRPLRLRVIRKNSRAKRLYERLGFSQVETLDNHDVMELK